MIFNNVYRTIKGGFIVMALLIVVLVSALVYLTRSITSDITGMEDNMKELVGEKVLIENDTLTIIDYSLIKSNYTLNNENVISKEYAKKNIVK